MATGVTLQRGSGTSQKKYRRSPNNAPLTTPQWSMAMESFRKNRKNTGRRGQRSEWTFEKIREAYEKVAMDDVGR